jgi:hypothetical protein
MLIVKQTKTDWAPQLGPCGLHLILFNCSALPHWKRRSAAVGSHAIGSRAQHRALALDRAAFMHALDDSPGPSHWLPLLALNALDPKQDHSPVGWKQLRKL